MELSGQKIGLYCGEGASHSWLWFADLADRANYNSIKLLDEKDVVNGGLSGLSAFFISGGDTFGIARALGGDGALQVESFVRGGGTYVGACAGAYLPLNSSKKHLNMFNFVSVKIKNLVSQLPPARKITPKMFTFYGCQYVFHPAREEVALEDMEGRPLKAPLYGGPMLDSDGDAEILFRYSGFTDKTDLLVDEPIAADTMINHAALMRAQFGKGCFYLFGPHFEHPSYHDANKYLCGILKIDSSSLNKKVQRAGKNNKNSLPDWLFNIKKDVSNARIAARGFEFQEVHWKLGEKYYEPQKIFAFLSAIWPRIKWLETLDDIDISEADMTELSEVSCETAVLTREISKMLKNPDVDATDHAARLFPKLKFLAAQMLRIYFHNKALNESRKGALN